MASIFEMNFFAKVINETIHGLKNVKAHNNSSKSKRDKNNPVKYCHNKALKIKNKV